MENYSLSITLSADDIQPSEFASFIESNYHSNVTTSIQIKEKEGRNALEQFTKLVFSDGMAVNLLSATIGGIVTFGFTRFKNFLDAKPKATIKLKNGKKIELPASMSEAEINAELTDCLQKGYCTVLFF